MSLMACLPTYKFVIVETDGDTLDGLNVNNLVYKKILRHEFNHGATRNLITIDGADDDIYIFLTQDAIVRDSTDIDNIVRCFDNVQIAAICGRQLPHNDANPIACHLRHFNYPTNSRVMSKEHIRSYGIKTIFLSNSFAAYRADVFRELGGFSSHVILGEDMHLAARMILAGYKVAYTGDACVRHSHNYTPWQELTRYFDTGVFHASEPWIQEKFGGAGGEGKRFIISEFKYLLSQSPLWIPRACVMNLCKIIGYKLGKNYRKLPESLRLKLSMHKAYWLQ
ncbi:hypothetical protein VIM7927_02800 [Vibrio mangrovi]|nr:hypothetical protein VIM7927_02800 [Vibrio mangrovi]